MAEGTLTGVIGPTAPFVIQGQRARTAWRADRIGRSVAYYTTDVVTISRQAWQLYQASLARRGR